MERMGMLILMLVASTYGNPVSRNTTADGQSTSNILQERIKDLQKTVAGIVTQLSQINSKLDNGATTQHLMEYIHKMKKLMVKEVLRFPSPVYGDENAKYYIQGHVEIFHSGEWGTICDDYFDSSATNAKNTASVLCRMQGYESGAYSTSYKQTSAPKASRIWMQSVTCTGKEKNVGECNMRWGGDSNCNHSEDIGLRCYL